MFFFNGKNEESLRPTKKAMANEQAKCTTDSKAMSSQAWVKQGLSNIMEMKLESKRANSLETGSINFKVEAECAISQSEHDSQ